MNSSVNPRFEWTDEQVRSALDVAPQEDCGLVFTGVSTDSRTVSEGNLFVALSGDSFDGHDYVSDAFGRGARGAVVARSVEADGACVYPVEDTLLALGQLAGHRRRDLPAVVVGITGSSGKTGTKELTRAAIEGSLRVHATPENLNNRIGVPLTLLDAPEDAEVVVLEMGTNEPGEIATLTQIAEPRIGVVTTVSETHIEKLESLEGVLEEKLDLLRGLPSDGKAVVGDEPTILSKESGRIRRDVLVVGLGAGADSRYRPEDPTMDEQGCWSFVWRGEHVHLRVPGRHSLRNALLALTVAELLDVPAAEATRGVGRVEAGSMRGEVRRIGGLTLIVDCYNANPQSVRAALDLLVDMEPGRPKVAVLGSMLELGARSEELHTVLLDEASALGLELLVATGDFARAAEDTTILSVTDPLEAYEELRGRLAGDEVLLMKASRSVALERLLPLFENDFGVSVPASRRATRGAGKSAPESGEVEA